MSIIFLVSYSNDDVTMDPLDNRVFAINIDIDYFINFDNSVNLIVLGNFQDNGNFGTVTKRRFVYSTTPNP